VSANFLSFRKLVLFFDKFPPSALLPFGNSFDVEPPGSQSSEFHTFLSSYSTDKLPQLYLLTLTEF
jgi:hypothetical protein